MSKNNFVRNLEIILDKNLRQARLQGAAWIAVGTEPPGIEVDEPSLDEAENYYVERNLETKISLRQKKSFEEKTILMKELQWFMSRMHALASVRRERVLKNALFLIPTSSMLAMARIAIDALEEAKRYAWPEHEHFWVEMKEVDGKMLWLCPCEAYEWR